MPTNTFQLNVISNWGLRATITVTKVKAGLTWSYTVDPLSVAYYGASANPSFEADEESLWQVTVSDSNGSWATDEFKIEFPASAAGTLYSFIVFQSPNTGVGVLGAAGGGIANLAKSA